MENKDDQNMLSDEFIDQSQNDEAESENKESEYKIWKKNAPYLYDILITWGLDWPSLTVNWLPKIEYSREYFYLQKMIIGTFTNHQEPDYLIIAKTRLPKHISQDKDIIDNQEMIEKFSKTENKIEIETKIRHNGEVNKAKAMPQEDKCNIIATKTNNGEVNIYDYFKFPPRPIDDEHIQPPTKILKGHSDIGYGLSWSTLNKGYLLSGSYDSSVCIWDVNSDTCTEPIFKIKEHTKQCEDVCFSKKNIYIFGSCGDDKKIILSDYRDKRPIIIVEGHEDDINSIDFHPSNEFLYITGSSDKTAALWDFRKPDLKMHSFIHHKNAIINVKWNYNRPNIFASSGEDNKVLIWDLTQIGANISREDNEDAPSEMIFEHGGHMDKINEIDWNCKEDMMCASVDNLNNLHIWEMNVNNILK